MSGAATATRAESTYRHVRDSRPWFWIRSDAAILTGASRAAYLTDVFINGYVKYMPGDPLSLTFAALSNPTRRAILDRLAEGECSVMELAEPFAMSLPAVSRHLRVLEDAGLIVRGRAAQYRPCRLEPEGIRTVAEWAEQYRVLWSGRLDRLDAYLRELKPKETGHGRKRRSK